MTDMPADSLADDARSEPAPLPGPLISLEEAAVRLLLTGDGAYKLLRRSELPYVLVLSQWQRGRLRRRVAITPRTFRAMLRLRVEQAPKRGAWTHADNEDLGL